MIFNIIIQTNGDSDGLLRSVFITTDSSFSDVIAPGFLKQTRNMQFYESDSVNVLYDYSDIDKSGTNGKFTISFSDSVITLSPVIPMTVVSVTNTTKTLLLSDQDTIQDCSNADAQTITVPLSLTVPFIFGIPIIFKRSGAGAVSFVAASGVTIQSASGHLSIASQYSQAYLMPMDQNLFWLYGDLSA